MSPLRGFQFRNILPAALERAGSKDSAERGNDMLVVGGEHATQVEKDFVFVDSAEDARRAEPQPP